MNVLICGLPGTGKTTLCKKLASDFEFNYITDYEILSNYNIIFNNSVEIIDKNYFYQISSFFEKHEVDNCVLDFNYCLLPDDINKISALSNGVKVFLGYYDVSINELAEKFREKNSQLNNDELNEMCELLIDVSKKYKILCDKCDIDYVSINQEKSIILKKLQNEIEETINN